MFLLAFLSLHFMGFFDTSIIMAISGFRDWKSTGSVEQLFASENVCNFKVSTNMFVLRLVMVST